MLEQVMREQYQQKLVNPLAKRIENIIQPTTVTIFSGLFGIAIIPALFLQQTMLAIILLLLSGYLDTLDGTIARNSNKVSSLGAILDILMDRSVEFAVVLGLWLVEPLSRSLLCILMLGCILLCVSSFLVVGIFTNNQSQKSFHYSPGLVERPEAFIFFGLMIGFPAFFNFFALLFCLLILLTAIYRVYEFSSKANTSLFVRH